MTTENILAIQELKTYFYMPFGIGRAVDGINLTIGKKKIVGLVGESGCGKTMTALSITRLVPSPGRIVDGKILFQGKNLLELSDEQIRDVRGKSISMIFQDPMTYLNPVMKVGDQIAEVITRHQGLDKAEAREKVIEMLQKVRMPNPSMLYDNYAHKLSGGMRQRIMIAIALICNPSLIIADEPTTALDVTIQLQILELIKKIREKDACSLLLITHDMGIVAEICDRVYIMYVGKIVESADVFALYENPKHPYTVGLLKSVLSIENFYEKLPTIAGFIPEIVNSPLGCKFHTRCPQAKPICRQQEPSPIEIDPGHTVSCWLYA